MSRGNCSLLVPANRFSLSSPAFTYELVFDTQHSYHIYLTTFTQFDVIFLEFVFVGILSF